MPRKRIEGVERRDKASMQVTPSERRVVMGALAVYRLGSCQRQYASLVADPRTTPQEVIEAMMRVAYWALGTDSLPERAARGRPRAKPE
ncbi:hypothetical protein FACS1894186_4730 [Alphaproteobacteria bacterium]|nr:hypothetical protein FACS1894186_4730 [Alphaproteobacteria bacterium]